MSKLDHDARSVSQLTKTEMRKRIIRLQNEDREFRLRVAEWLITLNDDFDSDALQLRKILESNPYGKEYSEFMLPQLGYEIREKLGLYLNQIHCYDDKRKRK